MIQPGALVWRGVHLDGSRALLDALSALTDEGEATELVDVYAAWLDARMDPRWPDPRVAALQGIDNLAGYAHPYTAERIRHLCGILPAEAASGDGAGGSSTVCSSAGIRSQDEGDVVAHLEDQAKAILDLYQAGVS